MSMRYTFAPFGLLLFLLVGCTSLHPHPQLSDAEQGLYRVYSRIMTPSQRRTYLTLPTASERATYAKQIGASQVLEALPENERAAVLQGYPFEGMSEEALLLLWGEPYLREGPPQDERWYYYGDYFSLAKEGSSLTRADTVMEVRLENGHLEWWQERVPSEENRFIFRRHLFNTPAD